MAKAVEAGVPVYTSLADLARQFDPNLGSYHQHPSAYPPTVVLLVRPLAELSYIQALLVWDVFELLCFVIASLLVVQYFRRRTRVDLIVLVIFMCVLWPPFYYDLYHGQVMMTILLLLTVTWLALTGGRRTLAGIFLGLLFAVKLYAWPIALLLILKRNYRTVFWAGGVFLVLNAIVAVWLGVGTLTQYYFEVAPANGQIYRTHPLNFSLFGQGSGLFGPWFGFILAAGVLVLSLVLALRSPDFDHAFMIMAAATIILSPVSWAHYMVTLLPALCLVASLKDFQIQEKVLIALLFYVAVPEIYESFLPRTIIRLIPVLFVLGLMVLLSRQLRKPAKQVEA